MHLPCFKNTSDTANIGRPTAASSSSVPEKSTAVEYKEYSSNNMSAFGSHQGQTKSTLSGDEKRSDNLTMDSLRKFCSGADFVETETRERKSKEDSEKMNVTRKSQILSLTDIDYETDEESEQKMDKSLRPGRSKTEVLRSFTTIGVPTKERASLGVNGLKRTRWRSRSLCPGRSSNTPRRGLILNKMRIGEKSLSVTEFVGSKIHC